MSLEKIIIEGIREMEASDRTVEKSIPMKKEWTLKLNALKKAFKEANIAKQKAKRAKQAFWAMIEEDLDIYDRSFQISENHKEIEILAEKN